MLRSSLYRLGDWLFISLFKSIRIITISALRNLSFLPILKYMLFQFYFTSYLNYNTIIVTALILFSQKEVALIRHLLFLFVSVCNIITLTTLLFLIRKKQISAVDYFIEADDDLMETYNIEQASDYLNKPVAFLRKLNFEGKLLSRTSPANGEYYTQVDLDSYLVHQREAKNSLALVHQFCEPVKPSSKQVATNLVESLVDYYKSEQVRYLSTTVGNNNAFLSYLAQKDKWRTYYKLNLDDLISYATCDKDLCQLYLQSLVKELGKTKMPTMLVIQSVHKLLILNYDLDQEKRTWSKYPNVKLLYCDTQDNYDRFVGVPIASELNLSNKADLMHNLTELAYATHAIVKMKHPKRCLKDIYKLAGIFDENDQMENSKILLTNLYLLSKRLGKAIDDIKLTEFIEML